MSNPVGSARRNSSLAALIANTLLSAVSGITALRTHIESSFVRGLAGLPDRVLRALVREPVAIDGQHLHVEVQLILKLLALAGEPLIETLEVPDARAQIADDARAFEGRKPDVARVEQITVSGAAGPLDARLYVPHGAGEPGLLVYFHGGGFVVCDLETHDNACRLLAGAAGVRVLAVDYRLAPEQRFPAAVEDALAAFRFAVEHAGELGADPARVAVGGDSAGGNLAAGVAQSAAAGDGPPPAFQLLFYPWLDLSSKRASYRLFGEGFFLTEATLDWYAGHYLAEAGQALDARCSPLLAEQLDGIAPAYITTAGFDPLRDEGEEYAQRLRAAGVPVALHRQAGLIHGFVNAIGVGHAGREALLEAAGALRVGLALAPTSSGV
jgi:acetyl esterase